MKVEELEFQEVKRNVHDDLHFKEVMIVFFIGLIIFLRFFIWTPISPAVPIILLVWLLSYLINEQFLPQIKKLKLLHYFNFAYSLFDLIILTAIVHFLGGVEWVSVILYAIVLFSFCTILPRKQGRFLIGITGLLYVLLILSEYFNWIAHHDLLPYITSGLYRNPAYVIVTTSFVVAFLFFFGDMIGMFSETLRRKRKELIIAREEALQAYQRVEEAKQVLEIRVKARTQELRELADKLEDQVTERTSELQKKVQELEKMNRLMVGRELKMIDLKKQIKKHGTTTS